MNREIIKCTYEEVRAILDWDDAQDYDAYYDEYTGDAIEGIWNDFDYVETDDSNFSLYESYIERVVIVKRKSDGKYFKGDYCVNYNNCNDYDNLILTEVFPIEKTITVYE
jgi:hypothetical protein